MIPKTTHVVFGSVALRGAAKVPFGARFRHITKDVPIKPIRPKHVIKPSAWLTQPKSRPS